VCIHLEGVSLTLDVHSLNTLKVPEDFTFKVNVYFLSFHFQDTYPIVGERLSDFIGKIEKEESVKNREAIAD